jgi:predicted exporter/SAM-dependent methyltransferase
MNRIVVFFYEFFKTNKPVFYTVLISLFVAFGYFTSKISFQDDITKMIPDDASTNKYKTAIQDIRILDKIIVSFTTDQDGMEDSLIAAADRFVSDLNAQPQSHTWITEIRNEIDETRVAEVYELLYNNLPVYLSPSDYARIDSITTDSSIKESIDRGYHKLISPASLVLKQFVLKDPLAISSSALGKLQGMQAEENYELYNGHIFRKDKKTLVVFITPKYPPNKTRENGPLIDMLNKAAQTYSGATVNVNYFGAAAVAVANARQIEADIKIIATTAILVILVFLYLFYRSWSLPFLMMSPILFGGVFSLAMIYLIKGSISAIAIGAGSVIIGIALDYSFHVFAHYQHTRSIKAVVNDIATPMLIGSVSTVGAFFSLLYVHSEILSDFGLFAGLCLIGASLFALFFLPHLIEAFVSEKQLDKNEEVTKAKSFILKVIQVQPEKSKLFIGCIAVLTLIFVYFSNRVSFDSDLSKINYMSDELRAAENALYQNDTSAGKSVFLLFKGKTISEAIYRNETALPIIDSFKKQDIIHRYAGISGLLPSDSIQLKRIAAWNAYWTPEKIAQVQQSVAVHATALGFRPEAFTPFFELLSKKYAVMRAEDKTFMQHVFLKDYIQQDSNGVVVIASMRVPQTVDNKVYSTFDKIPGLTILDRQLFYNKFLVIIKDDFNQILMSTSILVFLILLISYGRIELAMISFFPMVISWFWILGLMGIFNIHFNIVNIIISTFVFGLGDDYSIFITDGLQKKYAEGKDNLPSYKVSIFLSAFTTIIAMGALIFAKHPALKSIAAISIIGITCVVIISYTLIPLLFKWVITNRTDKGKPPLTLITGFRTVFFFLDLGIMFLILCLLKLIFSLFSLLGLEKISRSIYKSVVCVGFKILIFFSYFLKQKKRAFKHLTKKDAFLILVNDETLLTKCILLSLHSKVVLLKDQTASYTLVEKALFYIQDLKPAPVCVASQAASIISGYVGNGYSPVYLIDTREAAVVSTEFVSAIKEANAEVAILFITGTELSLVKNDWVFNRAHITIQEQFVIASDSAEMQQLITTAFTRQLDEISVNRSMSVYFNKILTSYVYKGPVLEWYYRIKVGLEDSYNEFNTLVPRKGVIYDLGCGYGFLDYFLMHQSSERIITGVDYDGEKIIVANHSYLKNDQLTFIENDVMQVDMKDADAIIILDVLHYLSAENQRILIRRSFEKLNPGGILIIRDGDSSQESKHKGTKLTEFFSTKLLKFNKQTEEELCFISSDTIIKTLEDYNVQVSVVDTTVYTSNIMYYVVKQ